MLQKNMKNRHFSSQIPTLNIRSDTLTSYSQKIYASKANQINFYESPTPTAKTKSTSKDPLRKSKETSVLRLDHKSLNSINFQDIQENLQKIVLDDCKLKDLPANFCNLINLKQLSLESNYLTKIPIFLLEKMSIESFSIKHNLLEVLPEKYYKWSDSLFSFDFSHNQIDRIENNISELKNLRRLVINNNNFIKIPTSISTITFLDEFELDWFKYTFPPNNCSISGDLLKKLMKICESFLNQKHFLTFIEFLELMSTKKLELNKTFTKKRNLIHRAAVENDIGALRSLIYLLPDTLNDLDSENYTPLFSTILEENYNATKILLFAGADPGIGLGLLGSCIHLAVVKKEVFLLQDLLRKGGDPNSLDQQGNTPIHLLFSTFSNNFQKGEKMAKTLMEFNSNPQIKNKEFWTCLHLAVKAEQVEAVRWAIQYNKNEGREIFNFYDIGGEINMSLLHLAGHQGNREIVTLLLDYGCDYSVSDSLDRLPKNLCVNDQFLIKIIKSKEKKDLKLFLKKSSKNSKKTNNLQIEVNETEYNEDSHNNITMPFTQNSNNIKFFTCKSKYFSNQNNLNSKLFEGNAKNVNDEDIAIDVDESNDRRNKTIRVILKSPNNIGKLEQFQNARNNVFRKSCENSLNLLKNINFSKSEKKFSLKTFSFQNLETIVEGINKTNEKLKEELKKYTTEIIENQFLYLNTFINLQKKHVFLLKKLNLEVILLNSLFKDDPKAWLESRKEFERIMSSFSKKESALNACNNLLLNIFFLTVKKTEIVENMRICLLIIQNIPFLSVFNFRDALKLFLQKYDKNEYKLNKIIVYEIYSFLKILKKSK